ncbi:dephospho-CoA kinase [Dysgonomonas sp. 25]|uniref:dephospho-CoA kinase n=1 Tax=Dysgonomonas sp. 25 TaxID=2302933 RepID=UPI0013D34693|nr:dephospho-CoA kinase [Dysgonomonas sp. 25]NDV69577.1 dephospho-CoA kinase [Dysgonomonas sp. 25]
MQIIGITGGIGSGKSSVSEIFKLCGIPVYIADDESKRLTDTSPVIREKLTALFGESLYEGGKLNKPLLASIIFSDKKKLEMVNSIIHPEVRKDLLRWVEERKNDYPILATEAAIMFESGFNKLADKMITIYAPVETRIRRIVRRDNTSVEKARERINAQMSDEEKVKLSDFVIMADDRHSLIEQALEIIKSLKSSIKR